jgi:hypothetical protein
MRPPVWIAALFASFAALSSYAASSCTATSGAVTAAVVELYTSEGCSSCPPADRQLRQLGQDAGPQSVVIPLGLHVTYWDDLGWKDVLAQRIFDVRQQELVTAHGSGLVYTPQFFLNGEELRAWPDALPAVIRKINRRPAPVTITLTSMPGSSDTLTLEVKVASHDPQAGASLYLAITESALSSRVLRGENGGATLSHDNAVRLWVGPIPLPQASMDVRREVKLSHDWNRQHLQAVALVQDGHDDILQAVSTRACGDARGL